MKYIKTADPTLELTFTENINKDYGFHNHLNHYIITLVTEGSVLFRTETSSKIFNTNEFFIIPPYEVHSVSIDKNSKAISFCIEKNLAQSNNFHKIKSFLKTAYSKKHITESQMETFRTAAEKLTYFPKKELSGKFSEIIETFEDYSLDEISKSINISKYHLIRKFKSSVGLTPHKVQIQNRIRKSQKLLDYEKAKITDVCFMTGFYDQSHYDKTFKKIVGISPKEYIKSVVKI